MWCRHVRNQLSAFVDGELNAAAARAVEEHLAHCEACAREKSSLAGLVHLTSLIPDEEVPDRLHASILTRLAYADVPAPPQRVPAPAMFRSLWTGTALTGALAAAAFAYFQTRPVNTARHLPPEAPSLASRPARSESGRLEQAPVTEPSPVVTTPQRVAVTPSRPEPVRTAEIPPAATAPREVPAAAVPEAVKTRVIRLARTAPPRDSRPQPAPLVSGAGKAVTDPRDSEPTVPVAVAAEPEVVGMPGSPVVNSTAGTGQPEPVIAVMEKDPTMRMAGMAVEVDTPSEGEDEGLNELRNFFEERNRNIPQPPVLGPGRDRRVRKSL